MGSVKDCLHNLGRDGICRECRTCFHRVLVNSVCVECGIRPLLEAGDFESDDKIRKGDEGPGGSD